MLRYTSATMAVLMTGMFAWSLYLHWNAKRWERDTRHATAAIVCSGIAVAAFAAAFVAFSR